MMDLLTLTDDEDEEFLELADLMMRQRSNFRLDPLEHSEQLFKDRYRLSVGVTEFLVDRIKDDIKSGADRDHNMSAKEMVLVTLYYLGTGKILLLAGVDRPTTGRIIGKVVTTIAKLGPEFINMPKVLQERNKVAEGFLDLARFPRCIGAIGSMQVKVIPHLSGEPDIEAFRNRKGDFSYKVQCVCDSNLRILNIVARWPGSVHDATIFNNSLLKSRLENGEFGTGLLVGSKAFNIKPYLMTPLSSVEEPAEKLFNKSLVKCKNRIERCFNAMKKRFPILELGIVLKNETVQAVIVACAVLHNMALVMGDQMSEAKSDVGSDIEINGTGKHNKNNVVRQGLISYFEHLL